MKLALTFAACCVLSVIIVGGAGALLVYAQLGKP